jgi:hypothetical protein
MGRRDVVASERDVGDTVTVRVEELFGTPACRDDYLGAPLPQQP